MRKRARLTSKRTGLSLVELVISTMLVGMVLVGAMNCVGAVIRGRLGVGDSGNAEQLLRQLMSEIVEQEYLEPVNTPLFGTETSENGTARSDWDDVDDYHLWSASPPQDRYGSPLPNLTDWQRDVVVEWVDPSNPSVTVGSDQGVKRITVTVRRSGQIVAQDFALRSDKYTGN
jgi:hypothetical protein